jgi:hypothetical protein
MPADERRRLDHGQGLPPIESAGEPYEGDPSRMSGALWFDVTLLIQRELFAQKEILCRKRDGPTQTEPEVPQGIGQECQQYASELLQMVESA